MAQPSWTNTPEGTMQVALLSNPGHDAPEKCFTYPKDYPKPSIPSPDWCLVRVHAFGLNRAELRGRTGYTPFPQEFNIFISEYHPDPPQILGEEFVGVVEVAGSNTLFKKGEKVAGWIYGGGKAFDGSYAEYTICPARRLYSLPQDSKLSWAQLAAIPMSMWTAHGCVNLAGGLNHRDPKKSTVMIHGGTSSVGIWVVLLAKKAGATVLATTRNKAKAARLLEAGADHVILEDEIDEQVKKICPKGVDIIVELVGPDQILRMYDLLARYGTCVVAGVLNLGKGPPDGFGPFSLPPTRNLSFYTMTNGGIGGPEDDDDLQKDHVEGILRDCISSVESGEFKEHVVLDKTFTGLEAVGEAQQYMEDNKATGKVVVTI